MNSWILFISTLTVAIGVQELIDRQALKNISIFRALGYTSSVIFGIFYLWAANPSSPLFKSELQAACILTVIYFGVIQHFIFEARRKRRAFYK
jgi:hypothetical protein